jgi:hypothetical protein
MSQEKVLKEIDRFDQIALLRAKGFETVGYAIKNRRVYFQFEDSLELDEALRAYQNNSIKMNPKKFGDELRQVIHLSKEILKGVNPNGN